MNAAMILASLDSAGYALARYLLMVLWQSSLLMAATGTLAWALRRHRPGLRHALWMFALLAAPFLPLLTLQAGQMGAPQAPVEALPVYHAALAIPAEPDATPPPEPVQPLAPASETKNANAAIASVRPPANPIPATNMPGKNQSQIQVPTTTLRLRDFPWVLILLIYAMAMAVMLTLVLAGSRRLQRWLQEADPDTDQRVLRIFAQAAQQLNLAAPYQVRLSAHAPAPVTMGILRAQILLPSSLPGQLDDAELMALALHELAHVRRHDPLWLTLAALLRALFFLNPMVWLATRRAAALAEHCADDAVLEAAGQALPYAKMLARLAEGLPRRAPVCELATGLIPGRSSFLRRIEAILGDRSSIRGLTRLGMVAIAVAVVSALLLALALPLVDRGPRRSSLYEKAKSSGFNLSVKVGPNRFKVNEVVRNDANGNAHREDGRGRPLQSPSLQAPDDLKSCAPWMDAADIDFGIESSNPQASLLYDVIETRVFDHVTRQPLESGKGYEAVGYELMQPGMLQLRALGKPLPDAVDVWFRINSYADARRLIMQPTPGSFVQIGSGTLSVVEMREGTWSKKWGGDQIQWLSGPQNPGAASTIALQWQGAWPAKERWQIGGVTKGNQRAWGTVLNFTGHLSHDKIPVNMDMPLGDIAYLELRQEGIQRTFYFNNVLLPAVGNRRFLPPPPARFKIDGKEGKFSDYSLSSKGYSLSPIQCSITVGRGNGGMEGQKGVSAYRPYTSVNPPLWDQDKNTFFIFDGPGLDLASSVTLVLYDFNGGAIPQSRVHTIGYSRLAGLDFTTGVMIINYPLDKIASVDMYIDKDPLAWGKVINELAYHGNSVDDATQRLRAALAEGRNFTEALAYISGNSVNRTDVASVVRSARAHFSDDQYRQAANLLLGDCDSIACSLVEVFIGAPNRPGVLKEVARLADSEKPWLWMPALVGSGSATNSIYLRDAGLLTRKMRIREALLGGFLYQPDLQITSEEKATTFSGLLTPRFLQNQSPSFIDALKKMAEHLGPKQSTELFIAFLRQLVVEWDKWQVHDRASMNPYAIERIALYLNLWHGTNFGGYGADLEHYSDSFRPETEYKALAEEIVHWADSGIDPGKLPAGWTPGTNAIRVIWRSEENPQLSMIGLWDPAQETSATSPMTAMETAGDFLNYRIELNGNQGQMRWNAGVLKYHSTGPVGDEAQFDLLRLPNHVAVPAHLKGDTAPLWRHSWTLHLEKAAAPAGAIEKTQLFAQWKAQYLSGPIATSLPKVFAIQTSETMKAYATAYVMSRRNTTGWTPAEIALREAMDHDPKYVVEDLRPYTADLATTGTTAAWHRFLQRTDLTPEMQIFAWVRLGTLEMANPASQQWQEQLAKQREDFAKARAVDPDLVTYDTVHAHVSYAYIQLGSPMDRARNCAEALEWLLTRTDAMIAKGVQHPRVVNWPTGHPIVASPASSEDTERMADSLRENIRSHVKTFRSNAEALEKSLRKEDPAAADYLQDRLQQMDHPVPNKQKH